MTPRATPTRAWGKRQWGRLIASIIGLAMVAGSSWYVLEPQWTAPPSSRHGLGKVLCKLQRPAQPSFGLLLYDDGPAPTPGPDLVLLGTRIFIRAHDHIEYVGEWTGEDQMKAREAFNSDTDAWAVNATYNGEIVGWWAQTGQRWQGSMSAAPVGGVSQSGSISTEQSRELRRMFLEAVERDGNAPFPLSSSSLTATGAWKHTYVRWSGYAINTATILGLSMFLWCTPLTIRDAHRAWRFRAVTACKSCGYDLRGLAPNAAVCPECGASISPGLEAHP